LKKTVPSGIEICETQFHLANKIKDVVDHEIDNYLPAINNVLENLSKEELIKENGLLNSTVLSTIIKKLETFKSIFRF
jgi:hypothetical protein